MNRRAFIGALGAGALGTVDATNDATPTPAPGVLGDQDSWRDPRRDPNAPWRDLNYPTWRSRAILSNALGYFYYTRPRWTGTAEVELQTVNILYTALWAVLNEADEKGIVYES